MAEAKKTTTKKNSSTTAKKTTTAKKSTTAKKTTTASKKPSKAKKTTAKKDNTKAIEKAINNTYHIEDSQLEKMSKIELENEVKTLEFKLHELEDDNLHLMERIHKLTIDHKSGSNTTRISKEIVVDEKDPFNSMYGDRTTLNARKNFWTFFDLHFHSVLKGKLIWILLFALPIVFTSLSFILSTLGASFELTTSLDGYFDIQKTFASRICNVFINWIVAIPLLVLTCIILPTFIVSSREDNLLKRLTINSINRTQLFWFFILSSTIMFVTYEVTMLFGWMTIINFIANSTAEVKVWDGPLDVFEKADISLVKLLSLTSIFFLGLLSLGFYKSMSVKEAKAFVAWGTGLFIFSQFAKLSVSIIDMRVYAIELEDVTETTSFILSTLLFMIKFMFIFTIPTWVFVAVSTVGRGPSKWSPEGSIHTDEFDNAWYDSPDKVFLIVQLIAITLCVAVFIYVWYNKNKIIKLETVR